MPLLDFKGKPNAVDELVCFQEAQTLPLFLIVPKTKPTFTPMTAKPPFNLFSQIAPSQLALGTQSASSGSSSSTPISSTMTRAAFGKLKTQALIDYLIAEGVELDDQKQTIFRQQEIEGETLFYATRDDLITFGLPGGVVLKILNRIPK